MKFNLKFSYLHVDVNDLKHVKELPINELKYRAYISLMLPHLFQIFKC
jgi:hypothetical protein